MQPHQYQAQPTDAQQRASAISSMGLGDPMYPPPSSGGYAYGYPPHMMMHQQPYPPQPYPQQPYYHPPQPPQPYYPPQQPYYSPPVQQPPTVQQPPAFAPQQQPLHQGPPPVMTAPFNPPPTQQPSPAMQVPSPNPIQQEAPADWGLDGLDFSAQPAAAPPPTATLRAASSNNSEVNDWPAPSHVDPTVWAQLPAEMQRELLMQQANQDSPRDTTRRSAAGSQVRSAAGSQETSGGMSTPRGPTRADDPTTTTIIEVMARISARTLHTKQWKPSVCVIKNKRELLVFRSRQDWIQYRSVGGRRDDGADLVQILKESQDLLKKHVILQPRLTCTPIKAKDYKGYGNLHHFTLEEGGAVVAKFASTVPNDLFQLRNAITIGIRLASGLSDRVDDDGARGRYHG